jgi:nucleotide-binding universal stress UspA family protein
MVDIVVGVDASTSSALALRWALEEARLHNSGVRAVLALPGGRLPSAVERAAEPSDLGDPTAAAVRVLHRLVMEATLARAHEALRPTGETSLVSSTPVGETTLVSETVVRALPADALLRASATAHMLVVGAPGHSRPRRACAGSLAVAHDVALAQHTALADESGPVGPSPTVTGAEQGGVWPHTQVKVLPLAVDGVATANTLSLAQNAQMLVVGAWDQDGRHRWTPGDLTRECVIHAPCPVAVVRPE